MDNGDDFLPRLRDSMGARWVVRPTIGTARPLGGWRGAFTRVDPGVMALTSAVAGVDPCARWGPRAGCSTSAVMGRRTAAVRVRQALRHTPHTGIRSIAHVDLRRGRQPGKASPRSPAGKRSFLRSGGVSAGFGVQCGAYYRKSRIIFVWRLHGSESLSGARWRCNVYYGPSQGSLS